MNQHLTSEIVNEKIKEVFEDLKNTKKIYKRGLLTEKELIIKLIGCYYYSGFWDFIYNNSLFFNLTADNYSKFLIDYNSYKETKRITNSDSVPWLCNDIFRKSYASEEDKRLFIALIDGLRMKPELFEPVHSGVAKSQRKCTHLYTNYSKCFVTFECINDDGLSTEPNPTGKTFMLVNDLGLEAVLRIKEDRRQISDSTNLFLAFVAEGYIEGYTAKENRNNNEIEIEILKDSRKYLLHYWEDSMDAEAHFNYPLWQEYHQFLDQKSKNQRTHILNLFKSL